MRACSLQRFFWQDAGIYLAGIQVNGNVYPPGFPLYMIVAEIWTKIIPIYDLTTKVYLLSAVSGALASVICAYLCYEVVKYKSTLFKKLNLLEKDKNYGESDENKTKTYSKLVSICGALYVLLAVSTNYNLMAQAINAEVYAPQVLVLFSMIILIIKIGKSGRIEKNIYPLNKIYIISVALLFGISLAIHPMAVLMFPVIVVLLLSQKNIFYNPKLLVICALVTCVFGAVPYLYLPITASKEPILNWGNPNTPERFIKVVTGGGYLTGEQSFTITDSSRYQAIGKEVLWDVGLIGLVGASVGFIILWRSNRVVAAIVGSTALIHIIFAIIYKQTTEYNSWLIPAHAVMFILCGVAITTALQLATTMYSQKKLHIAALAIVFALMPILTTSVQAVTNYKELNRKDYWYAEDFGKNILRNLDKNSLLVMTGDQESSTVLYLQLVKKYRQDVITLKNIEFEELTSYQGRQAITKRYPNLPIPEDTNQDIDAILNQIIDKYSQQHSVYLMSANVIALDQSKFSLLPAASLWKVSKKCQSEGVCQEDIDLKYWDLKYHDRNYMLKKERPLMSLKDPTQPGGIKRVKYIQHMINFELQAWKNLGDWYLKQGKCTDSEEAYNRMERVEKGILQKLPGIMKSVNECKQASRTLQ